MSVLELVGSRVWIKCDQFRKISGVVSSVVKPMNRDDRLSSIAESLFEIVLPTGRAIQLFGAQIHTFEPRPHGGVLRSNALTLAAHPGD